MRIIACRGKKVFFCNNNSLYYDNCRFFSTHYISIAICGMRHTILWRDHFSPKHKPCRFMRSNREFFIQRTRETKKKNKNTVVICGYCECQLM